MARRPRTCTRDFTLFGPTCDSADVMRGPFLLPADVAEGDWIEIGQLGAYGACLRTAFNGFDRAHGRVGSARLRRMLAATPASPDDRRRPGGRGRPRFLKEYRPMKHAAFAGRLVMLGFGSIGQGVLPLILRHIDMPQGSHQHPHRRRPRRERSRPNAASTHHGRAADARQLPRPCWRRCWAGATSCSTCRSMSPRSR